MSDQVIRGKRIISNGTYQVIDYCIRCMCNANKTHILSHKQVEDLGDLPILGDYAKDAPPCDICGSRDGTEYHHWAVRHIFKDDADQWPGAFLCRSHHSEWHKKTGI